MTPPHVLARIESRACIVIFCTIRAPGMQACVSARIISRACFRMCVCTYGDTLSPRKGARSGSI
jgi:hypothetical protein